MNFANPFPDFRLPPFQEFVWPNLSRKRPSILRARWECPGREGPNDRGDICATGSISEARVLIRLPTSFEGTDWNERKSKWEKIIFADFLSAILKFGIFNFLPFLTSAFSIFCLFNFFNLFYIP